MGEASIVLPRNPHSGATLPQTPALPGPAIMGLRMVNSCIVTGEASIVLPRNPHSGATPYS